MTEHYRNWHIHYDPPPIPARNCDWHFWHDDYDGAEDAGENRYGHAESLEAAKAEIDLWYDEEFICPRCRDASPDSCLALVCPDRRETVTSKIIDIAKAYAGDERARMALLDNDGRAATPTDPLRDANT